MLKLPIDDYSDDQLKNLVRNIQHELKYRESKEMIKRIDQSAKGYVFNKKDEIIGELINYKGYSYAVIPLSIISKYISGYVCPHEYARDKTEIFQYLDNLPPPTTGTCVDETNTCYLSIFYKSLTLGSGLVYNIEEEKICVYIFDPQTEKLHVYVHDTSTSLPNNVVPWSRDIIFDTNIQYIKFDNMIFSYGETMDDMIWIKDLLIVSINLKFFPIIPPATQTYYQESIPKVYSQIKLYH